MSLREAKKRLCRYTKEHHRQQKVLRGLNEHHRQESQQLRVFAQRHRMTTVTNPETTELQSAKTVSTYGLDETL